MTEQPKLDVLLTRAYGNDRFYPINSVAKTLCQMTGIKTFTKEQLLIAKEAGWEIVVHQREYSFDGNKNN